MSTYTDLHNKVKESLNVDYHSRETNQKSLFLNPENEYWGTFHGEVDVKGAAINSGVLSDVTIYKANLICSSLDGVDVTTFGKRLRTLDEYVHGELTEKIDLEDVRLQNEIDKEVAGRIHAIQMLSSNLSIAVNGKYNAMLTAFDAEVSARIHGDKDSINYTTAVSSNLRDLIRQETSARAEADAKEAAARISGDDALWAEACVLSCVDRRLSSQIIDVNQRIDAEANTRKADIDILDFRIDSIDSVSEERYLSAMSALAEHANLNVRQLEQLSAVIDDKVEHDRHYSIVGSEELRSTYPYVLKDFAVNRLEISAIDGYVYHTNNIDDRDVNVATVVCENGDGQVPITFTGLQHNDPVVYSALNPNISLRFDEDDVNIQKSQGPASGREFTVRLTSRSLDDAQFILERDGDTYLPVIFDGRLIGKVHGYDEPSPGDGRVVKKGVLTITSLDTDLAPFKHIIWPFNVDEGKDEYVEPEVCIKYNHDNTFSLGYRPVKCQQLIDETTGKQFGRVYDGDIIQNEAMVKSVRVKVGTLKITDRTTDEKKDTVIDRYFVLSAPSYVAEVAPFVYLSCQFSDDYSQYGFRVDEVTKHWKYKLKLSTDSELTGTTVAYATVGTPNEKIEDNAFATLSVDFSQHLVPGLLPESFSRMYCLTRDKTVPERLWKATAENAEGDLFQVTYDGAAINVKMIKKASEGITYIKFLVDTKEPAAGIDKSEIICDTGMMVIDTKSHTEWTYLYDKFAQMRPEEQAAAERIELGVKKNEDSQVKFVIPDRVTTNKDYSREMLLVVKFMSPDSSRKINVTFVDPSGNKVKYFYDKSPELWIDVNRYVTIKITEVASKRFLITDWNETEIRSKLLALREAVEEEVAARAAGDEQLAEADEEETAARISADDDLSAAIDAEAEDRIAADNVLSNKLSTFIDDHYSRTFDMDVQLYEGPDSVFDMLKLVDETDRSIPRKMYTMHLSAGTVVLVPKA